MIYKSDGSPRYQQIALDIAQRIVNGQYQEHSKMHGRSTLSSMYQVSSETIRRAVALLEDLDVVTVHQRSGIRVNSVERAGVFIERFSSLNSMYSLNNDLSELLKERSELDKRICETMQQIVSYAEQLKNISPYNPVEVRVEAGSPAIGCTIQELRFWQNTGGTIVALRHGSELTISPGPYAVIKEGDAVVVVGDQGVLQNVRAYLGSQGDQREQDR